MKIRTFLTMCVSLALEASSAVATQATTEQSCRLSVVATVPEGTGVVYIAGNLPELGPWDPAKFPMQGTGTRRTAEITVPCGSTVEYKLTTGSWFRQAVDQTCTAPGNRKVEVSADTVDEVTVERFRGPEQECPWPDPTRFEATIAEFEAEDAKGLPPQGALLAVGSSTIRLWHSTIQTDLAPKTVIPRGFGGSNMNDLLHYADRVVFPYKPGAILLYEGDNDIAHGVFPSTVLAAYEDFFARVRERLPETKIYVLAIKPSASRWDVWPQMQEVNRRLEEIAREDPAIVYIDVATPMLGGDGMPLANLFRDDKLHMNDEGYALWTIHVRKALAGHGTE